MTRLKLAVLGAQHPHIFPRLALATGLYADECEVVAVYDRETRVREHIVAKYGVPVVDSPEAAMASSPDVVIVNDLDSHNPALMRYALPGPKAVLLEKVGAPNVKAYRELVDYCSGFEAHVTVAFMLHRSPAVRDMHEIVASGVLGPVTLARFHASTPVGCSAEIWQSIPEDTGGMVYTDGIHMMREIVGLLGTPDSVTARIRRLSAEEPVYSDIFKPDILSGLGGEQAFEIGNLRYEDAGAMILDYGTLVATFDMTAWEAHNWVERWRLELYGANGTLTGSLMPPFTKLSVRRPHPGYEVGEYERVFTAGNSDGAAISLVPDITYEREIQALLAAARDGSTDQSELRVGLQCVEVMDAAFRSSQEGTAAVPVSKVEGLRP